MVLARLFFNCCYYFKYTYLLFTNYFFSILNYKMHNKLVYELVLSLTECL
jgi:hypothetical protein